MGRKVFRIGLAIGLSNAGHACYFIAVMLSIEGTYKNGKVELAEIPRQVKQSRVLVTFLESSGVDLRARGIDDAQAAELRARLKTFAEDWERPEADIYDKDAAR